MAMILTERTKPQQEVPLGLMRVGGALMALPVDAIREVVPGQAVYQPLPTWADGIIGGLDLRGTVIPVFDLRRCLDKTMEPLGTHVILIMRWDHRVLGLVADQICGLVKVPQHDLFALDATTTESLPLVTHTFRSSQGIGSVLDPERLVALPGLPMVADSIYVDTQAQSRLVRPILLFKYRDWNFGLDAACVETTMPISSIGPSALADGYCLGVIDHHGYDTPVVDTAAALGLSAPMPGRDSSCLILRFSETAKLAFIIDEVSDIVRVQDDAILPMPIDTIGPTPLFRGIWADTSGRSNLILEAEAVCKDENLLKFANMRTRKVATPTGSAPAQEIAVATTASIGIARQPVLTYLAGGERATQLTQIAEILPMPAQFVPMAGAINGLIGLFSYKGQSVPLFNLSALYGLDKAIEQDRARVLVVAHEGRRMGFLVEALKSIEAVLWQSPTATRPQAQNLVIVGSTEDRRIVSYTDLIARIDAMSGAHAIRTWPRPPALSEAPEAAVESPQPQLERLSG